MLISAQKPYKTICPGTLTSWLILCLQNAKRDTDIYKAPSVWAAPSKAKKTISCSDYFDHGQFWFGHQLRLLWNMIKREKRYFVKNEEWVKLYKENVVTVFEKRLIHYSLIMHQYTLKSQITQRDWMLEENWKIKRDLPIRQTLIKIPWGNQERGEDARPCLTLR